MTNEIIVAFIGIGSALLGTIIGGISTYYSNKAVKELDWKHSVKREDLNYKKKLYSDFLSEANALVMKSLRKKTNDLSDFDGISNYLSQIELVANDVIVASAKNIVDYVLSAHVANEQNKDKNYSELRKIFAMATRDEFNEIIAA